MSVQERVKKATSEEATKKHHQGLWFYSIEGALVAAIPIVAMISMIALEKEWFNPVNIILFCSLMLLLILPLRYLLIAGGMRRVFTAAYEAGLTIRSSILKHLTSLPMGSFHKLHVGKIAQVLSEDVLWIETWTSHNQPTQLAEKVLTLIMFISVLILNPFMALTALVTFSIGIAFLWYLKNRRLSVGLRQRSKGMAEAARHIMEFAEGMTVIRSFGDSKEAERDYDLSVITMREGFKNGMKKNTPLVMAIMGFAMLSVGAGAIVGVLTLPENAGADPYFVAALVFLTAMLIPAKAALSHSLIRLLGDIADENIQEIESVEALPDGQQTEIPQQATVSFENVSFAYEDKTVIHDVSFSAAPGSLTAIVGGSGAGKSTLMNLLLRFWDVKQGKVSVGGIDIREFTIDSWMNRIAVVFQETVLFRDTVANNIRVGRSEATMDEVVEAAKAACIHERIMQLPGGYESVVGHGGSTLSGGERQRVTIARAFLKEADILILDEATSALDPENEHELQTAFTKLAENKTVFIIAHRLSTIVAADNIILLNDGRIEDQGTHESLLERSSLYQKQWESYHAISNWKL